MKRINLVFEYDFGDVDIILVPDYIADNIEDVVQLFFRWASNPENRQQFQITTDDGNMVLGIGTKEFLWWLNNIKIIDGQSATIIKQHTTFCSKYPVADF